MSNYFYYQMEGGEEAWHPAPISQLGNIRNKKPMFITALMVDKLADDTMDKAEIAGLKYTGDFYLDWDDANAPDTTAPHAVRCIKKMIDMGVNPEALKLYATGGKGFHCVVPAEIFMEKIPKAGTAALPYIFRELALELVVDTLDLRVYSGRRGRMWREPNVKRPNGKFKVPITWTELQEIDKDNYVDLCSGPRHELQREPAEYAIDFAVLFEKCKQKVAGKVAARKKQKPTGHIATGELPSFQAMCEGRGIRSGIGFHPLAMQIAIVANARGMTESQLIEACQGLIENHVSDGDRYNTPKKRELELLRMLSYTEDNPCYDVSVGALKSVLSHQAPDLDGLPIAREDIEDAIAKGDTGEDLELDEFSDVAGVSLTRFGVYVNTEFGQKRVCAVSFSDVTSLKSLESNQLICLDAQVLVNGKAAGRQALELETFYSLQSFNRFCARLGHAFQGTDSHVRGMYMRAVEMAKKNGKDVYVTSREGLDIVNIPNHENPALHEPFMIWSDSKGVILEPRARGTGIEIQFQGYPDQRGQFRTDLGNAPKLVEWLKEPGNKDLMASTIQHMLSCQKPEVVGKVLGWTTACFYRMLSHKAYGQFPVLHINGAAGSGKCLGRDTPVLMADGSVKMVQDVQTGDYLLGPDGGKRLVLGTTTGREMLYKVTPVKGDAYTVNASHILSLRKSEARGAVLADGTRVTADADIVNVNVKVFAESNAAARKTLKGWRAPAVDFHHDEGSLLLDPYWLGCWLGDGDASGPYLHKPECNMTRWWVAHAEAAGHFVTRRGDAGCAMWAITKQDSTKVAKGSWSRDTNDFRESLKTLNLLGNKHIPQNYLRGSRETRLRLLAGLLDSDGHMSNSSFDWVSKDQQMAQDFTFLCRSLGLACYMAPCIKSIKSVGFEGQYWRCSVSGDTDKIPCLDKRAPARRQVKRHLVTGVSVEPIGEGDYYGFELDGDHLFLLGDFTVTHNTSMFKSFLQMFYYHQEPKMLSPTSTAFAITYSAAGSTTPPLTIDEYKPHEMPPAMHDKLKLMCRDSYNGREVQRGGGTRENDDYRALHSSALFAPVCIIAEAVEEESALLERVVLATFAKPGSYQNSQNFDHFMQWREHGEILAIIGQYLAAQTLAKYSTTQLTEDFNALYRDARAKYLYSADDLTNGTPAAELIEKQQAKERTVFNFTVSRFGLIRFRRLMENIYGDEYEALFGEKFREMEADVYNRMSDLYINTQAEWLKVFNQFAEMSHVEEGTPYRLRKGMEYALIEHNGKPCVELYVRASYSRYRIYCRALNQKPLYQGEGPFVHGLRDCPALVSTGDNVALNVPGGSHIFGVDELQRLGFRGFKD